jgi:hypothetical protein
MDRLSFFNSVFLNSVNDNSFVEFFGTHGPKANIFDANKFNALFS